MPVFWSYEREKQIRDEAYAEGQDSKQKEWIFRWKIFVENIRLQTNSFDQSLENTENAEALSLGLVAYIRFLKDRNATLQKDNKHLHPSQVPLLERQITDLQSELSQARRDAEQLRNQIYKQQSMIESLEILLKAAQNEKSAVEQTLLVLQNRLDQQGKKSAAKSS